MAGPCIYLDNHATTPVDPRVRKAMWRYFSKTFGNAGSATHSYGWEAKDGVEAARAQVAEMLGARPDEIVFTSGATESNNLAIKGIAEALGKTAHIITQPTEHESVLEPVKRLVENGWKMTLLRVDRFGRVDPDDLQHAIRAETVLVSIMAANNEVGTIQPIKELATICRKSGVLLHTDATQAIGKTEFNLQHIPADLVSLSGHKIYGPKGQGALVVRRNDRRVQLRRIIDGGDQEFGLRPGTLPVPLVIGLGKACDLCQAEWAMEIASNQTTARSSLQRYLQGY